MSKTEIKKQLISLLKNESEIGIDTISHLYMAAVTKVAEEQGWATDRSGEKWSDDELRAVLSDAPTQANAFKHARAFRRKLGSVQLIYRYAVTSDKHMNPDQADNTFIKQIKKIADELSWLS
jgi:hypothetical protein